MADEDFPMTPRETAAHIGCNATWLAQLRMHKRGPKFVKFGRFVRYRRRDVDAWLESNKVGSEP